VRLPSTDPVNFVNFRGFAGGKPIPFQVETRAYFYDQGEITSQLNAMGLPISPASPDVTAPFRKLTLAVQKKILDRDWMHCPSETKGKCYAQWQMRAQFYWTQRFPAGLVVRIRHEYEPVVGGGYIVASDNGRSNVERYCGGAPALTSIRAMKKRNANPKAMIFENQVRYILTTANTWRGPIGRFHLIVDTDSPENLLLTCMPGLARTSGSLHEVTKTNFRPDRELDISILRGPELQ
jgi:hypothetical protein